MTIGRLRKSALALILLGVWLGGAATSSMASDEAAVLRGAKLFARTCAACHGRNALGDGPGAADLDPAPRDLSTTQFRFRTSQSGSLPTQADLERTIRQGLPGSDMPGFGQLLSSGEITDLTHFIYAKHPDRERPSEGIALPPVLAAEPNSIRDGRVLYILLGCPSCHDLRGTGRGPSAKSLVDEGGRRIRPPDFRYDPLKGGREPEAIVRTLMTGLNGAPMPSYSEALILAGEDVGDPAEMENLRQADRKDLDEFARTLPTRAEIEGWDEGGRTGMRDRHLAALTHYILSLSRRESYWARLFRLKPEQEPRVLREAKKKEKPSDDEGFWDE